MDGLTQRAGKCHRCHLCGKKFNKVSIERNKRETDKLNATTFLQTEIRIETAHGEPREHHLQMSVLRESGQTETEHFEAFTSIARKSGASVEQRDIHRFTETRRHRGHR